MASKKISEEVKKAFAESKASQQPQEMEFVYKHLKDPKVILEIGVDQGHALNTWAEVYPDVELIGVDNEEPLPEHRDHAGKFILGNSKSDKTLEAVKKELGRRKVDLLFLDGDHTADMVRSDFEMYSPLVKKGGIVAIHDIGRVDECWKGLVETREVFDELATKYKSKELTKDEGMGIGIIWPA